MFPFGIKQADFLQLRSTSVRSAGGHFIVGNAAPNRLLPQRGDLYLSIRAQPYDAMHMFCATLASFSPSTIPLSAHRPPQPLNQFIIKLGPGLWNPEVQWRIHKGPIILSWAESTQFLVLTPISLRSILILSSHQPLELFKSLFPVGLPVKLLKELLPSSIAATFELRKMFLKID